jgi:hypothetical protein
MGEYQHRHLDDPDYRRRSALLIYQKGGVSEKTEIISWF